MGTGPLEPFRLGIEKMIKPALKNLEASMTGNNGINPAPKSQVLGTDASAVSSNSDRIQQFGDLPPLFDFEKDVEQVKKLALATVFEKKANACQMLENLEPNDEGFAVKQIFCKAVLKNLDAMRDGIKKATDAGAVEKISDLTPEDFDFEKNLFQFSNPPSELNDLKAKKLASIEQKLGKAFTRIRALDPRDAGFEKDLKALNAMIDGYGRMKEGIKKAPDAQSAEKIAVLRPEDSDFEKKLFGSIPLTGPQRQEYNKLWGGYANDERYPNYPNDANRAFFMRLSPEDRQTYCDLRNALKGDKGAYDCSEGLLEEFTASPPHVDAQGRSILEVLKETMSQELCPELAKLGLDKKTLLAQLVNELRGSTITQGKGTDTCATASIQNNIATKMPAEYARIVTDLLTKGVAILQEGKEIKLSTKALSATDGRPELDDLIQGTFIDFARQFPAKTTETYSGRGGSGGSYRGSTELPGGGITANQIQNLYRFMTGSPPAVVRVTPENKEKVMDAMRAASAAGYDITAGIHLDGDPKKGHAINVTQILSPELYSGGEMLSGLSIEDSEANYRTGYLEYEIDNIDMIVIPEEFAQGFTKDDALTYDWSGSGRGGSGGSAR